MPRVIFAIELNTNATNAREGVETLSFIGPAIISRSIPRAIINERFLAIPDNLSPYLKKINPDSPKDRIEKIPIRIPMICGGLNTTIPCNKSK